MNQLISCQKVCGNDQAIMANLYTLETFCINDYDVIGFDLDGCLLKYKWNKFFEVKLPENQLLFYER